MSKLMASHVSTVCSIVEGLTQTVGPEIEPAASHHQPVPHGCVPACSIVGLSFQWGLLVLKTDNHPPQPIK